MDQITDLQQGISAEQRLSNEGIVLPELPVAGGNYVSAKTVGKVVYLSGVISIDENGIVMGQATDIESGYRAARLCGLTQLAVLKRHLGTLDAVQSVVSVNGYVNAPEGFSKSPEVINGFSDLMVDVFGEAGRHVRAAVGVSALPRNAMVEVQMAVEIF
jgi:enamine deaminase RidA (YjgF/YER057c/UK114 family)